MIWECSLRGQAARRQFDAVMDELSKWIRHQPNVAAFETAVAIRRA
jgi:hypothetical protein